MTTLGGIAALLLHACLVLAAAPLAAGAGNWIAARLAGRAGPSPLQPFRDLRLLCRKQATMPESASMLFTLVPVIALAASVAAALLVPSFTLGMATAPLSDILVIIGLLALGRVALALGAMDPGTAGEGAGRGVPLAVAAAPGMLLAVLAVASQAGTTNLDSAAALVREAGPRVPFMLALAALLIVASAQSRSRPGTSDWSGRLLAMAEAASMLEALTWLSLAVALFVPFGVAPAGSGPVAWLLGMVAWSVKIALSTAGFALVQAARAPTPAARMPELLATAALLSLLAVVLLFVTQGLA